MKIEIDPGAETPTTLRAFAAMLVTLAGGASPAVLTSETVGHVNRTTVEFDIDEAQIDALVKVAKEGRLEHATDAAASHGSAMREYLRKEEFAADLARQFATETSEQARPHVEALKVGDKRDVSVFTGATSAADYFHVDELAEPAREVPLPPAPPIAAAALFSTVHVAQVDGAPTLVPPPPAPFVPAPPVPTAPAPATDPALDVNGVAWDAALHASTRAKNVDGTWRARRNLGEKAVPPPPPIQPAPVPAPPEFIAAVRASVAAVPPPPIPGLNPFPRMMRTITDNITAGRITKPQVNEVLAAHGVMDPGQIAVLSTLPDTATKVTAALIALGAQNV